MKEYLTICYFIIGLILYYPIFKDEGSYIGKLAMFIGIPLLPLGGIVYIFERKILYNFITSQLKLR